MVGIVCGLSLKQTITTGAECGTAVEQYSDEELGLCIITLATFVHREPAAAAAMLPALLHNVSRYTSTINSSPAHITPLLDVGLPFSFARKIVRHISERGCPPLL